MSTVQTDVLVTLARSNRSTIGVASAVELTASRAQKVLDGLLARGLVYIDERGYWGLTDRGRKRVRA